jgi:hypothetical protein
MGAVTESFGTPGASSRVNSLGESGSVVLN